MAKTADDGVRILTIERKKAVEKMLLNGSVLFG